MKYDKEIHTLAFASEEEAARLRLQLTDLLREALGAAHGQIADTAAATARSRATMKRYNAVMRLINTLRLGGVGGGREA